MYKDSQIGLRAIIFLLFSGGLIALCSTAVALQPGEQLEDKALELRAENLDKQLRCVVCVAQSIASSEALLARDMRKVVRDRLKAGDTDQEVLAFMAARYGDEILLKPPVQANTLILWMIPVLILGFMAGVGIQFIRANQARFKEEHGQSAVTPPESEH